MSHLLIIELPGGNDTDLLQAAIDRGDEFTFLTACPDHYLGQPAVAEKLAMARECIAVRGFEYEDVSRRIRSLHTRHPIDAILCLIDTRLPEAARLAQELRLRHLNPASAALLRDKGHVRERLARRAIPTPEFEVVASAEALHRAVERMGLPVLIKPVDGYGSQNIVVLRYPEDVAPPLCPLDSLLPQRTDYGLGVYAQERLLVERYMEGQVIGCDTFSLDGRHTLLGIHDKNFFEPPSFAIRGGCFTPRHAGFASIEMCLFEILDGVGFDHGAAHTELMLTSEGPRLIEVNPRLVGAKIPRLVGQTLGRDIHADLIDLHLGRWSPAPAGGEPGVGVTRWIVASEPGILERVELPEHVDAGVRVVELLKRGGDRVRPPMDNADRLGYVIARAPIRAEAERIADEYVARTRVTVLPRPVTRAVAAEMAS